MTSTINYASKKKQPALQPPKKDYFNIITIFKTFLQDGKINSKKNKNTTDDTM